ncbi:MAG: amidophosphoribosyltransferase, partial [bacterium]
LIASSSSVVETAKFIGADTLGYLSLDGMLKIEGLPDIGFCDACFSGNYPIVVEENCDKGRMDKCG